MNDANIPRLGNGERDRGRHVGDITYNEAGRDKRPVYVYLPEWVRVDDIQGSMEVEPDGSAVIYPISHPDARYPSSEGVRYSVDQIVTGLPIEVFDGLDSGIPNDWHDAVYTPRLDN